VAQEALRLAGLRECLATTLLGNFPNAYVYGHPSERLPGHLSFGFRENEGEVGKLLTALDQAGVAVSAGSACSAHHGGEPSGVLRAMGYDEKKARGLIRVSLGRFNTRGQVLQFLNILENVVANTFRPWASAASARSESAHEQEFQSTNC
jgi:cysteine desulfurase